MFGWVTGTLVVYGTLAGGARDHFMYEGASRPDISRRWALFGKCARPIGGQHFLYRAHGDSRAHENWAMTGAGPTK